MATAKKPIAPIGLGCLSLAGLFFMCSAFGSAFFWFDEAESYENIAEMEERDEMMGRGSGFLGSAYWRSKSEEYAQFGMGSLCCGVFSLLMFFGGAIGAVVMFKKHKNAQMDDSAGGGGPPASGGFGSAPGSAPGGAPPGGGFGSPPGGPPQGTPPAGGGFGPPPGGMPPQ